MSEPHQINVSISLDNRDECPFHDDGYACSVTHGHCPCRPDEGVFNIPAEPGEGGLLVPENWRDLPPSQTPADCPLMAHGSILVVNDAEYCAERVTEAPILHRPPPPPRLTVRVENPTK